MCTTRAGSGDSQVRVTGLVAVRRRMRRRCARPASSMRAPRSSRASRSIRRIASHLIGVWQQDRWSDGGARGLRTGYSFDGGLTWSRDAGCILALHRRHRGERRRLRARQRPVGHHRSRRHRVPDCDRVQRQHVRRRLVERRAREPLDRRRPHVERPGDADSRRRRSRSTTRNRSPPIPYAGLRVCDVGPARPGGNGPAWFARTTNGGAVVGSGACRSTIRAAQPDAEQPDRRGDGCRRAHAVRLLHRIRRRRQPDVSAPGARALGRRRRELERRHHRVGRARRRHARPAGPDARASRRREHRLVRRGTAACSSASGRTRGSAAARATASRFRARSMAGLHGARRCRSTASRRRRRCCPRWRCGATARSASSTTTCATTRRIPSTLLVDAWLTTSTDGVNWSERHVAGPFDFNRAPTAEGGLFIGDYQGLASASGEFVAFVRADGRRRRRPDRHLRVRLPWEHGTGARQGESDVSGCRNQGGPLTPAWQQQVDRIAQKTLSQRRIGPSATAPPRAPALP